MNYRKYFSNFPSTWLADRQWPYQQANHSAYSNPGTQVGTQNKDFGAVSQTDCGAGYRKWALSPFNMPWGATKFVLLNVSTLIQTICPKLCSKLLPKNAKCPLPVGVRVLILLADFSPPDVRPNSRKNFEFHFQKYRTLNNDVWKYCWNGYIWNVPGLSLSC